MRSPGWWLQIVGLGHAPVAAWLYRDALKAVVRDGVVDAVPDHGERPAALWCLLAAPSLWLTGRLLRAAEESGDLAAQRVAGRVLTGVGLVGAAANPASGFWLVAAVGAWALRRGHTGPR